MQDTGKLQTMKTFFVPRLNPEFVKKENRKSFQLILWCGLGLSLLGILGHLVFPVGSGVLPCTGLGFFLVVLFVRCRYHSFVGRNPTFSCLVLVSFLLLFAGYIDAAFYRESPGFLFYILLVLLPTMLVIPTYQVFVLIFFEGIFYVYFCRRSQQDLAFGESMKRFWPVFVLAFLFCGYHVLNRLHMTQTTELMRRSAEHDALTGLFNRNGGVSMIRSCVAGKMSGSFIMVDVDNFKYINDTFGHQRGDEVLKAIANVLHSSFKATDIVMRLGGDEFAVYAIGLVDRWVVSARLEQINQRVQEIPVNEGAERYMSVSIGCAVNDGTYPTYESLYHAADKVLYKTKEAGKNSYRMVDTAYRKG